jgi:hypothetical protein
MTRTRKTRAERLLEQARKEPSPTINDPRQISFFDHEKAEAFAKLDEAIAAALEGGEKK